MSEIQKPIKLTVQVHDHALYRAIRHLAVDQNRSIREIVLEALRDWILKQENLEDLAALREARDEPGVPWEQVKAEIRAAEAEDSAA